MTKFLLHAHVWEAKNLPSKDSNGYSDPYVKFKIGKEKQKTQVHKKTLFPVFNEEFTFIIKDDSQDLKIEVWDKDRFTSEAIGFCNLSLKEIEKAGILQTWFYLSHPKTKQLVPGAAVHATLLVDKEIKEAKDLKNKDFIESRKQKIQKAFKERANQINGEEKKVGGVTLFIGSWNVGNAPPPDDLSPWIKKSGFDIYAIGAQECKYESKSKQPAAVDWVNALKLHFGDNYQLLAESHLWQIRLVIFVEKKHLSGIHSVESSTEATGIASVMGNKGGTVIAFTLNDLSLCFVNAHLAAHQSKLEKRNADVAEVIGNIKMGFKKQQMDILNQYHHVFWCGDLNYRLDYGDQGEKETPSKEQFELMVGILEKKKIDVFYKYDQLHRAMEANHVFVGFQEGFPMKFPPTFKVRRSTDVVYEEKRSPAWCDRILWRSFQGHDVKQLAYDYAPGIATSDHKPVFATFSFDRFLLPAGWDPELGACTLTIKKLEAEGIPAGDLNGLSDPFIEFYSPFIAGNRICTTVIKKTLSPKWEDKDVPKLHLTLNRKQRLEETHIFVRVFDWDAASAADLLCAGVIFCRPALGGEETKFTVDLSKSGLPAGKMKGTIQLQWGSSGSRAPILQPKSLLAQPSSGSSLT